jgi:DNA-binding MarR family transcriptional regulator
MPRRRKAVAVLNSSLFAVVREFERFRGGVARSHGLSVTELRALSRIVEGGRITPKTLATLMEMTTGAVTALTDRLVEAGLVTREANPGDRRSLFLAPTEAGAATMAHVIETYEDLVRDATEEIDDDHLEEFAALLDGLVTHSSSIPSR